MARTKGDADESGSEDAGKARKAAKAVPRATMTIKDGERVFNAGEDVTDLGADEIERLTASGAVQVE